MSLFIFVIFYFVPVVVTTTRVIQDWSKKDPTNADVFMCLVGVLIPILNLYLTWRLISSLLEHRLDRVLSGLEGWGNQPNRLVKVVKDWYKNNG